MTPKVTNLGLLLVIVLFQLHSAEQAEVPGTLIASQAAQPSSLSIESCDGSRVFSSCSGCYDVTICLGNTTEYRACQYQTPDTPFCNNGECTAEGSVSSNCPPPHFTCTGVGFYPDPRFCQFYHYCDGQSSMPQTYQCPSGYAFNPESTLCKSKLTADDCPNVKCNLNTIFTRYGSSKKYYACCMYSGGMTLYDTRIYRCSEGTEFDGKTCVYKCTKEGRFGDSANLRVYYECIDSGSELVAYTNLCTDGKIFNSTISVCVSSVTV
ncbi:uncharacterized protein LOC135711632 [Ochlerotatus camptorhynchus]|uniref:uncharacterized protein LOC135711632 n=1 Tax=Ochlerotatus camptorhynchus TaxID=644619 RepID=UPI0031DF7DC8